MSRPSVSERYYDVDDGQVEAYGRDGHVLLPALADAHEVAAAREAVRAAVSRLSQERRPLHERDTYGRAFLQVFNLWRHDPAVAEFVLADRFAAVAARLLGAERVRIYHDQALFKEPGGGRTPWHQDALYWPLRGRRCVTMWMPLVDVRPEMGALSFASGTNTGVLSEETISDASDRAFEAMLTANGRTATTPAAMRAGDATFHGGWTVHRALPNTSGTLREVMTVIYVADGERVLQPRNRAQENDLETWLPGLRPGDPVASELNPPLPRN